MVIGCKTAPIKEHILNRLAQGLNNMEIHVLPSTTIEEIKELPSIMILYSNILRITGIHLDTTNEGMFIESIHRMHDDKLLSEILKAAQRIAEIQDHRVMLVTHTDMNNQMLEIYPESMDVLVNWLKWFNRALPSVDLSIENLTPITMRAEVGLKSTNSFITGNLEVVKFLRSKGVSNVYTTLDLAHTAITSLVIDMLASNGLDSRPVVMENIIEQNADYCNNIHFAKNTNMGLARKDHGVAFQQEDFINMKSILRLVNQYIPSVQLMLEVQEDDYTHANNAKSLKTMIESVALGEVV